jgi:hypothetical protein
MDTERQTAVSSIKLKKKQIINLSILIAIIALLVAIYLHAYMGTFSRYIADDYCTAADVKTYGFIQAILNRYSTWDGRYTFSFIIYLFGLLGPKFAAILPTISITAWLAAAFYFFKQIAKRIFDKPGNLLVMLVTSLFAFLTIYTVPQVADDFYWLTGVTTYLFSTIFEFFLLGFVINFLPEMEKRPLSKKVLFSLAFFFLAFIGSGFSEVSTALHVAIFGFLLLLGIVNKIIKKTSHAQVVYLGILFLGASLGFVFMAVSPGNAVRISTMKSWSIHPGIVELFKNSLLESIKYSKKWLFNYSDIIWPVGILSALAGVFIPSLSAVRWNIDNKNEKKQVLVYVVCLFILVYASYIPTTWMGYKVPEDRILIMTTTILSVGLVSCAFLVGFALRQSLNINEGKSNIPSLFLAILCLYFAASIPLAYAHHFYLEYNSDQKDYAQNWDRANAQILDDIKNGQEYIVADNVANDIMDNERIYPDPTFWTNQCAAKYYQVKEIKSR